MSKPERHLGRKTLEVEARKDAIDRSRVRTKFANSVAFAGRFALSAVAATLGVSDSNLVEQLDAGAKPRRRHHQAQDAAKLDSQRTTTNNGQRKIPDGQGVKRPFRIQSETRRLSDSRAEILIVGRS